MALEKNFEQITDLVLMFCIITTLVLVDFTNPKPCYKPDPLKQPSPNINKQMPTYTPSPR